MCGREWKTGVRHLFRVPFTSKLKNSSNRLALDISQMANGGAKSPQRVTGCRDIDRAGHKRPNQGRHGEDLWSLAAADQKNHPDLRLHDATRWRPQEDKSQGPRRLSAGSWEILVSTEGEGILRARGPLEAEQRLGHERR
jgi:hypothetical protein